MRNNWFVQGIITNAAFATLALVGGSVLTFLRHNGSEWTIPLLYGLAAFVMISVGTLALKTLGKLRAGSAATNTENVESSILAWLNNFRYTVKNDPVPIAYFRFVVTTDSGIHIRLGRLRTEFSDYISVISNVNSTPEDKIAMESMPEHEANRILLEVRLELARARVGYSGLTLPLPIQFSIFKRIPINDTLTEDKLIATIDEIEAALHSVAAVFLIGLQRNQKNTVPTQALQLSTSSPPSLEVVK